jgi:hypothetical protein
MDPDLYPEADPNPEADPDPNFWQMDPDPVPGGPKTYGTDGSGFGSATLAGRKMYSTVVISKVADNVWIRTLEPVFRICDILVRVRICTTDLRIRTRIREDQTKSYNYYGSGSALY